MKDADPQAVTLILIALVAGIVVLDPFVPRGIAIGVLYIIPALIATRALPRGRSLGVASVCTVLIVVGILLSPPGAPLWVALGNRGLSILTLWVTVLLSLRQQAAEVQVLTLQHLLPVCASCKSLRGLNGAWKPVDQYLEVLSKAVLAQSICPQCVEKWYPDLYPELTERYPSLNRQD